MAGGGAGAPAVDAAGRGAAALFVEALGEAVPGAFADATGLFSPAVGPPEGAPTASVAAGSDGDGVGGVPDFADSDDGAGPSKGEITGFSGFEAPGVSAR